LKDVTSLTLAPVAIKSALISRNRPAVFYARARDHATFHLGKAATRFTRGIFIRLRRSRRAMPTRWISSQAISSSLRRSGRSNYAAIESPRLKVIQAACDWCREGHGPLESIRVAESGWSFCAPQSAGWARRNSGSRCSRLVNNGRSSRVEN